MAGLHREPLRLLILAAAPLGTEPLRLDREIQIIQDSLENAKAKFEIRQRWATRPADVQREMLKFQPDVVHFCGHGRSGELILEDENEAAKPVSTEALVELFALFSRTVSCVLLNCCHSADQAEAIAKNIRFVVGMRDSISDQAAIDFAAAFYEALGHGKKVDFAFKYGLAGVRLEGTEDDWMPVLYRCKTRKRTGESGRRIRPGDNGHHSGIVHDIVEKNATTQLTLSSDRSHAKGTKQKPQASNHHTSKYRSSKSADNYRLSSSSSAIPYASVRQEIVSTLLHEREVVVFLGAGSSQEGRQGDAPFPAFAQLMERVLEDAGVLPDAGSDRLALFQEVVDRWHSQRRSLSAVFEDYLYGEPGFPHYALAALSLSLYPDCRLLLFLTTNYDDLMTRAFRDLERSKRRTKTVALSLPSRPSTAGSEQILGAVEAHTRNGRPVILKIFGDLDSHPPIFRTLGVRLGRDLTTFLEELFRGPIIFIGYSFSDPLVIDILNRSRGKAPIFIVTPQAQLPKKVQQNRRIYHLQETFSSFIIALFESLRSRLPAVVGSVEEALSFLNPGKIYASVEAIRFRAEQASHTSLLKKEAAASSAFLIERIDSRPNVDGFLNGDRPILAVTGDSGTGKSTLLGQLYQELKNRSDKYIPILYDVLHLQPQKSLSRQLAQDFGCDKPQLYSLLKLLEEVLRREGKTLVILIDALNESSPVLPSVLKADIEGLAGRLTGNIKLIYTCRSVYWETYLSGGTSLPAGLYFGAREWNLGKFSIREAREAFCRYQGVYRFRGGFEGLRRELQDRLRDPLMLRMLAEGYRDRQLPEFAPAVLIFDAYFESLHKRLKGTKLLDFLDRIVDLKIRSFHQGETITTDLYYAQDLLIDPILCNLAVQQNASIKLAGDPWVLLEDEGILVSVDAKNSIYRFSYDRFHEYLLGRAIGRSLVQTSVPAFISWLREIVAASYSQHFVILEAIKSEIVRRNIVDPDDRLSLYTASTLKTLLHDRDIRIGSLTKDIVRELTFDGARDILITLREIEESDDSWQLLALDIACDSPKIMPVLVTALLSGNQTLMRRSVHHLLHEGKEPGFRGDFEYSVLQRVQLDGLGPNTSRGLIYYTAVIFGLEDKAGRDPFPEVCAFWKRVLSTVSELPSSLNHLGVQLAELVKLEGILFFSAEARATPLDYLWKDLGVVERRLTGELIQALESNDSRLTAKQTDVIRFFGSEIRFWKHRSSPEQSPIFAYPLEFKISEWLLIYRSAQDFEEVLTILENSVNTGFWLSIDFALCNMEFILRTVYSRSGAEVARGFEAMKKWTRFFQDNQRERFFASLRESEPFSCNYIPIAQLAAVDVVFNTPEGSAINVIIAEIESNDLDRILLALLATRYFWKEYPHRTLATLRLFAEISDPNVHNWLNRILKEIFLVYPRLVEEFFRMNRFSSNRIRQVKERSDVEDAVGFRHNGDPLFKGLFFWGEKRRQQVAFWYKRLQSSGGIEPFCCELVPCLAQEVLLERS